MRYYGNWKRQYERCDVQVQSKQSSTAPVSSTSIPETIGDGEKSERVSSQMLQDNMVLGVDLVEVLRQLVKIVKSVHVNDPSSVIHPAAVNVVDSATSGGSSAVVDRLAPNHASVSATYWT